MIRFRGNSIQKKLTWMSMLASSSAMLLACAAFVLFEIVTFRTGMVRVLGIRAQIIGSNSVSSLMFFDPRSAEATLAALKADPHTISAGLYDRDGKLFASYRRERSSPYPALPQVVHALNSSYQFDKRQLLLFRDIVFEGERLGTVYIQSDLEEVHARLVEFALIGAGVLIASLVLAFLLSAKLQKPISETVLHLAATARRISSHKDYSVRATPSGSGDELALLTVTFNEMLSQIQQHDETLERERREVEMRVQERTAELQAANKELEAFTYSVSHDLRAPLRHIDGFSKLLVEEHGAELSEDARTYLGYVREGTREMSQLVDDLLNLARVGRKALTIHATGLNALVGEVIAGLKTANPARAIEWRIEPLPSIDCDPSLMKQVFVNLLSNAVKYTRPREVAVIEVGVTRQTEQSVIFVRDNGVGFNMKHADKLFGVFQRLHRQENFEGTGVGLAIVHRIIQKHGGRVWAEAELDRGATFYLMVAATPEQGVEASRSAQREAIYDGKPNGYSLS